ncbi:hypothetical protein PSEUDO8AS_50124 [Pseudomonas sp. 8AS]|nr:hypothetical protein PSEUDO8AS_50124 [Pseudomonas sp. 8AS]
MRRTMPHPQGASGAAVPQPDHVVQACCGLLRQPRSLCLLDCLRDPPGSAVLAEVQR